MTSSRRKLSFARRRSKERYDTVLVPFTGDELATLEIRAADCGLSVEDYLLMRVLYVGEVDGNA